MRWSIGIAHPSAPHAATAQLPLSPGMCPELSPYPPLPSPAVNLQPQLASVTFVTNNPTLTTVALEKPLCMFDSSEPLSGTYEVYLYVMVDSGKEPASLQKGP